MKLATKLQIVLLLLLILVPVGKPAWGFDTQSGGEQEKSLWDWDVNIRIWGADFYLTYNGLSWIDGEDTRLWFSVGGGYEDVGFYRNPDGTIYNPPKSGDDLGVYKRSNILATVGLRQGLFHMGNGQFELISMYRRSQERNLSSKSPDGSLVFQSSYPDRESITDNSILLGLNYTNKVQDDLCRTIKGFKAQATYEYSPDTFNEIADYHRTNFNMEARIPIYTSESTFIYFNDRLFYDQLGGNYIPISARNSVGGAGYFPGLHFSGLGGYIRGLPMGYSDGKVKAGNNLSFCIDFSSLWGWKAIEPGLISFYDAGVSGESNDDLGRVYRTCGMGLLLRSNKPVKGLNLILYDAYSFAEERSRLFLGFQLPF